MSKFGIDATNMGSPELKRAGHISPGVQDTSGAMRSEALSGLAKTVAPMVKDAYEGYQLAEFASGTPSVWNEKTQEWEGGNLKSIFAPVKAQYEAQLEVASSRSTLEGLKTSGGSEEQIGLAEKKFADSLATLKKAHDQGIVSVDELDVKIKTALRTAVNRNPGMEDKLRRYAATYLELSGASDWMKDRKAFELAQAKQKDEVESMLRQQAVNMGINPNEDPAYKIKVLGKNADVQALNDYKRAVERGELNAQVVVNDPNAMSKVSGGAYTLFNSTLNAVEKDPNFDTPAKKVQEIDRQLALATSNISNLFGKSASSPQVTLLEGNLKEQAKIKKDFLLGNIDKQVAENQMSILESTAKLKVGNFESIYLMGTLKNVPESIINRMRANGELDKFTDDFRKMFTGEGVTPPKSREGELALQDGLVQMLDPKIFDPEKVTNTLKSFHKNMNDTNLSNTDKVKVADKYVGMAATYGANESFSKLPTEIRQQAVADFKVYLNDAAKVLNKLPQDRPADLQIETDIDGTLKLVSKTEPEKAAKLNSIYTPRLNTALKAISNAQGSGKVRDIFSDEDVKTLFRSLIGQQTQPARQEVTGKIHNATPAPVTNKVTVTPAPAKPEVKDTAEVYALPPNPVIESTPLPPSPVDKTTTPTTTQVPNVPQTSTTEEDLKKAEENLRVIREKNKREEEKDKEEVKKIEAEIKKRKKILEDLEKESTTKEEN
jgi:hypothetical protein